MGAKWEFRVRDGGPWQVAHRVEEDSLGTVYSNRDTGDWLWVPKGAKTNRLRERAQA